VGSYGLTLGIRFVAGLGTALVWPLLAGYAARLAPPGRQNRAIAIALAGTPVSLALGIPLGTYMVAHNILYTYITDFLAYAGMSSHTGWVLLAFGVTSVLSVLVVGQHIDHHLRKLVVASTVLFAACVLVMAVLTGVPALIYAAAAAWGLAFGSSPSLFFAAAIDAAKDAPDVAQSITVTVVSGSIAAGGLIGGLLIAGLGTASITWAALILLVVAAVLVLGGRRHAFPSSG
jgi:predicted MFS family arabinose efflux permease